MESIVAGVCSARVGDDALQEISLFSRHHLPDQEATARISFADHLRVAHIRVYEARADLKKERSKKENFRPRGPNLVLDHFVLEVKWRLGFTGVQI